MSYHALARKYRPETFSQMVGQTHVTATLRAAMVKDKLSHAYLFSGPRGCGKTTVARLLAKALNCGEAKDGDPCGQCATCNAIAKGGYLDVLEIDAASNTGVDNIRELRDMAQYTPGQGGNRVFIIDEVHMLSKGAFNALLKILEEPPAHVFFFFATTESNKIPRTILSRCQRFDFRLFTRDELAGHLTHIAGCEEVALDDAALQMIVSQAEGSMRDGLSLLDQLVAGCDGRIDEQSVVDMFGLVRTGVYLQLNDAVMARDSQAALRLVADLMAGGQSLDVFAQGIITNFRNLLVLKLDPEAGDDLGVSPEDRQRLIEQAGHFEVEDLLALVDLAARRYNRIHRSTQPRVLLEAAVVEFALFESRVLLADLVRRLSEGGAVTPTGSPAGQPVSGAASARRGTAAGGSSGNPMQGKEDTGKRKVAAAARTVTGWNGFIQALMNTHPGLASCLMEGLPSVDEARGKVTLALPADKSFHCDRLRQQMDVVNERLSSLWDPALKLELTMAATEAVRDEDRQRKEDLRREVAPTVDEVLKKACDTDSRLGRLVDKMDAETVTGSERDEWLDGDDRPTADTDKH